MSTTHQDNERAWAIDRAERDRNPEPSDPVLLVDGDSGPAETAWLLPALRIDPATQADDTPIDNLNPDE